MSLQLHLLFLFQLLKHLVLQYHNKLAIQINVHLIYSYMHLLLLKHHLHLLHMHTNMLLLVHLLLLHLRNFDRKIYLFEMFLYRILHVLLQILLLHFLLVANLYFLDILRHQFLELIMILQILILK